MKRAALYLRVSREVGERFLELRQRQPGIVEGRCWWNRRELSRREIEVAGCGVVAGLLEHAAVGA
jgi:hypothetical protein